MINSYEEWEKGVPECIKDDSLWKVEAYRISLFLAELCWHDASKLMNDARTKSLSNQLYRAVGSIGANIAEGYSRGTGRDRARFYEYALGSSRESRDWYYKGRYLLGENVLQHRMETLTQAIKLLLKMVPQQRASMIRENKEEYDCATEAGHASRFTFQEERFA